MTQLFFTFSPEEILTNTTGSSRASDINSKAGELKLVCNDPTGEQSITFIEVDGRQIITYSYRDSGETKEVTLSEVEAADIIAWKNSGRRNSFWNWPEWDTVRNRYNNKKDPS